MKKIITLIACTRNRFDFWNSCKRLQNFVNVEALITHVYTTKTVLFFDLQTPLKNDVGGFSRLDVASKVLLRNLNLYPEWLNRLNWKQQTLFTPMQYQFCIAHNAVESHF